MYCNGETSAKPNNNPEAVNVKSILAFTTRHKGRIRCGGWI